MYCLGLTKVIVGKNEINWVAETGLLVFIFSWGFMLCQYHSAVTCVILEKNGAGLVVSFSWSDFDSKL